MKKSLLVAMREWRERVGSRSFLLFSILGPIVVLGFVYLLFAFGGQGKQSWRVLIADPAHILDEKILANENNDISYSFADGYIELEEFSNAKKYQGFDALLEVNEKVLANKTGFVFYRESPSVRMQSLVRYQFERRLEEVMVDKFTELPLKEFRKIKQPISLAFRDVYDPENQASDINGWVGLFYGTLIFVFIFLFGMTILRSVSREKSNRIVEVILASVSPNQLMLGKILGIGLSAFLQFAIWITIIGTGLYLMRENVFPDMMDASNLNVQELSIEGSDKSYVDNFFTSKEYNEFTELVYNRIQFGNMTAFFLMFFVSGYLFYGALFAAIGSTMGSESDGQQLVLPLIFILVGALYAGYYVLNYPDGTFASWFHYIPFTSPVVVMVKLSQGYGPGEAYTIYMALLVLLISAFIMLGIAARLYRNGILQFGHRVRFRHIFKWLRKT